MMNKTNTELHEIKQIDIIKVFKKRAVEYMEAFIDEPDETSILELLKNSGSSSLTWYDAWDERCVEAMNKIEKTAGYIKGAALQISDVRPKTRSFAENYYQEFRLKAAESLIKKIARLYEEDTGAPLPPERAAQYTQSFLSTLPATLKDLKFAISAITEPAVVTEAKTTLAKPLPKTLSFAAFVYWCRDQGVTGNNNNVYTKILHGGGTDKRTTLVQRKVTHKESQLYSVEISEEYYTQQRDAIKRELEEELGKNVMVPTYAELVQYQNERLHEIATFNREFVGK